MLVDEKGFVGRWFEGIVCVVIIAPWPACIRLFRTLGVSLGNHFTQLSCGFGQHLQERGA